MIFTYILGSGYLSDNLRKKIYPSKVFSAKEFIRTLSASPNVAIKLAMLVNTIAFILLFIRTGCNSIKNWVLSTHY